MQLIMTLDTTLMYAKLGYSTAPSCDGNFISSDNPEFYRHVYMMSCAQHFACVKLPRDSAKRRKIRLQV